jgi:DUF4097 and DUF4098 domain-containing protein YvlB
MKNVALILIGTLLASPALAERIDQTQGADDNGRIDIFNLSGDVEIIGWDRSEIQVTGTVGDDAEEFIFEVSGSTTTIKVKVPDRMHGHKDVSSDLLIRVPKGSSIDVSTVSADISAEGVQGEQELQSVSGDLVTEAFGEDIDAETVSGDVEVEGSNKDIEAKLESVSGDVMAEDMSGDIKAGSVSGDIDITGGDFSRARIETVNGDNTYVAALRSEGKLDVETINGTVDVMFVGDVSADFDIETFNGRIRNCFGPEAERTSKYAPGWELSFTEGDGNGRVTIATLNGGLKLCKE